MTDQEIEIKIKAEASKATSEIKKLNKEVARLSKVNKKAAASSKQVTESYKSFSSSIVKLASGFLALGTATKAIEFATMAADADQAAQSFTDVVTKMGGDSVAEFEKIKEASAGLISEAELNQAATTALLLGVPLSKLAELMEVARAKSREMGTDISTEFNNLATEIGRSSEMTADSLGKTVGELSKQEKALASTNEIIKAAAESVDSLNGSADTSKEKIKKMNTAISDLKVEVGRGLLPAIIELTEKTTEFIKSLSDADIEKMKEGIVSLTSVVVTLGKGFGVVVTGLAEIAKVFDVYSNATSDAAAQTKLMNDALVNTSITSGKSADELRKIYDENQKVINSTKTLIDRLGDYSGTDALVAKLTSEVENLQDANSGLITKIGDLKAAGDPYKDQTAGAKEATEAVKRLSDEQKKSLDADVKIYKQREKEHGAMINTLIKAESAAYKAIEAEAQRHANALQNIEKSRVRTALDIESQIAAITRDGLSTNAAQYEATQIAAAEAVKKAKEALLKGEYDTYKHYVKEAQSFYTKYANQAIVDEDKIKVSKDRTAQSAIAGLNSISILENQYYDKKTAEENALHASKQAQLEAERAGIIAQLELQYKLLEASAKLVEVLSNGTVKIDTVEAFNSLQELKSKYEDLSKTPIVVPAEIDKDDISDIKDDVESTDPTITPSLNDEKVKISITRTKGLIEDDETQMSVIVDTNLADFEDAKKEVEKQITTPHELDNREAVAAERAFRAEASADIFTKQYIERIYPKSSGGLIPQNLASGGFARKQGHIPGHDLSGRDDVKAMLTRGEFVLPVRAVDHYGVGTLEAMRKMTLPKTATAGIKIPGHYASGGSVQSGTVPQNFGTLDIKIGNNTFQVMTDSEVAAALTRHLAQEGTV